MINLDVLIPCYLQRSISIGVVSVAHVCLMTNLAPNISQQAGKIAARKHRNKLEQRLGKEEIQLVTNCHRLKSTVVDNIKCIKKTKGNAK